MTRRAAPLSAGLAVPFALLAVWLSGGVQIGAGNHAGLLPVVRRLLDPGYLPGDFGIELRLYHHRVFAHLLAWAVEVFGETGGFVVLTLLGMLLLMLALWRLARAGGLGAAGYALLAALLATATAFVGRGLEINDFLGNGPIMPPTFSHAAVLMSLTALLERRPVAALAWTGVVGLLHLQVAAVWLCVLLPLLLAGSPRPNARQWLGGLALLLLCAAPALLDLWRLARGGLVGGSGNALADIAFRMPHHFELRGARHALWPLAYSVLLAVLWRRLRRQQDALAAVYATLFTVCALLGALALLHFADYHLLRWGRIAQLQFIRLSPLLSVLGGLGLVFVLQRWFTARWPARREALLWALCLAVLLPKVFAEWREYRFAHVGVVRFAESSAEWIAVCDWVREHTPAAERFLTPPGHAAFVALAERSNVAEIKVNPDGGRGMPEWQQRLRALSGGEPLPDRHDFGANAVALDAAYQRLSAAQLRALAQRYQARYAILLPSMPAPGTVIYDAGGYRVLDFAASSSP